MTLNMLYLILLKVLISDQDLKIEIIKNRIVLSMHKFSMTNIHFGLQENLETITADFGDSEQVTNQLQG